MENYIPVEEEVMEASETGQELDVEVRETYQGLDHAGFWPYALDNPCVPPQPQQSELASFNESPAPNTADTLTIADQNESESGPLREPQGDDQEDGCSEDGETKEPLSYELQIGHRILKEIMSEANKSLNWPFMDPVDSEKLGLWDYHERVPKPMWLKKIKEKFDNREYDTITSFVGDLRLMLENCYRYNGPDHYVSKRGQKLELVIEQKLSLLSRELREKTSIAATSGRPVEEKVISGTRRRKVLVPHDSTALLNQLRMEEQQREKDARKQQMLEKKQQQEAWLQELQSWEDTLFPDNLRQEMRAMWEIPQIGHFLFLCTGPLNLGEVIHAELERSFALPRESSTMQLIMTSLLSTPYQRTRLDKKPAMPYSVWEEKLRVRTRQWYKVLHETGYDISKAGMKLGFEEKFFKVIGIKNPLERRKYHECTFYQKVWFMKGLCDWCLQNQESIREAMESQPIEEQRDYYLGHDAEGNKYIHFPQFCGADLRVYRQSPFKMPKLDIPKKEKVELTRSRQLPSPRKRKKKKPVKEKRERSSPSPVPSRSRDSRLRQNPRQVSAAVNESGSSESSGSDSGISGSESDGDTAKQQRNSQPANSRLSPVKPRGRRLREIADQSDTSRENTPTRMLRSRLGNLSNNPSRESTPTRSTTRRGGATSSRSSTPSLPISRKSRRRGKVEDEERDEENSIADTESKVDSDEDDVVQKPPPQKKTRSKNSGKHQSRSRNRRGSRRNNIVENEEDNEDGEMEEAEKEDNCEMESETNDAEDVTDEQKKSDHDNEMEVSDTSKSVKKEAEGCDKVGQVDCGSIPSPSQIPPQNSPGDSSGQAANDTVIKLKVDTDQEKEELKGEIKTEKPSSSESGTNNVSCKHENDSSLLPFNNSLNIKDDKNVNIDEKRSFVKEEQFCEKLTSQVRCVKTEKSSEVKLEDEKSDRIYNMEGVNDSSPLGANNHGDDEGDEPFTSYKAPSVVKSESEPDTSPAVKTENCDKSQSETAITKTEADSCSPNGTVERTDSKNKELRLDKGGALDGAGDSGELASDSSSIGHLEPSNMETESVSEANMESVSEANMESVSEANMESVSEANMESVSEVNMESVSEANMESVSEANMESVSEANMESVSEANMESVSEVNMESVSELNSESGSLGSASVEKLSNMNDSIPVSNMHSETSSLDGISVKMELENEALTKTDSLKENSIKTETSIENSPSEVPKCEKQDNFSEIKTENSPSGKIDSDQTEVKSEISNSSTDPATAESQNGGTDTKLEESRSPGQEPAPPVKQEEETEPEPEIKTPTIGEFELIVETVDELKELTLRFAEPEPIIEIKGKKERVLKPPPRRKCEAELYGRLAFLVKELEPWEQKLTAAAKKAKVKMRKEHESYQEEPPVQEVEDVWESEESVTSDSDDESSAEEQSVTSSKDQKEAIKKTLRKKIKADGEEAGASGAAGGGDMEEEIGMSSRGRVIKRRIDPNNIEDPGIKKRKFDKEHSPSPTPNILQSSKARPGGSTPLRMALESKPTVSQPSTVNVLNINNQTVLVGPGQHPVIIQTTQSLQNMNMTNLTMLAQLTGATQPKFVAMNPTTVGGKTPDMQQAIRMLLAARQQQSQKVIQVQAKSGASTQQQSQKVIQVQAKPAASIQQQTKPSSNIQQLLAKPQLQTQQLGISQQQLSTSKKLIITSQQQLAGTSQQQLAGTSQQQNIASQRQPGTSQQLADSSQQLVITSQQSSTQQLAGNLQQQQVMQQQVAQQQVTQQQVAQQQVTQQQVAQQQVAQQQVTQQQVAQQQVTQQQVAQQQVAQQQTLNTQLPQQQGSVVTNDTGKVVVSTSGEKPQFYMYNNIAQLPPQVIQQLLKQQNASSKAKSQLTASPPQVALTPTSVLPPRSEVAAAPTGLSKLVQAGVLPGSSKTVASNASHAAVDPTVQNQSVVGKVRAVPPGVQQQGIITVASTQSVPKQTATVVVGDSLQGQNTVTADLLAQQQKQTAETAHKLSQDLLLQLQKEPNVASQLTPELVAQLQQLQQQKIQQQKLLQLQQQQQLLKQQSLQVQQPTQAVQQAAMLAQLHKQQKLQQQKQTQKEAPAVKTSPGSTPLSPGLPDAVQTNLKTLASSLLQKPKYAGNVTVKSLLENRAAQHKTKTSTDDVEMASVSDSDTSSSTPIGSPLKISVSQSQGEGMTSPLFAMKLAASPSKAAASTLVLPGTGSPGTKVVVPPLAPSQQAAIGNAVKSIITEVQTSLPTAQFKVSSPFGMSGSSHRPVTITTSAMKSPIPSVPTQITSQVSKTQQAATSQQGSSSFIPPTTASITATAGINQTVMTKSRQEAMPIAATMVQQPGQKGMVLRIVPQSLAQPSAASTNTIQGVMTPQGIIVPKQQVMQAQTLSTNKPHSSSAVLMQNVLVQKGKGQMQLMQIPVGVDGKVQLASSGAPSICSADTSMVASVIANTAAVAPGKQHKQIPAKYQPTPVNTPKISKIVGVRPAGPGAQAVVRPGIQTVQTVQTVQGAVRPVVQPAAVRPAVQTVVRPPVQPVQVSVRPPVQPVQVSVRPPVQPVQLSVRPSVHPVQVSVRPSVQPVQVSVRPSVQPVQVSVRPSVQPVQMSVRPTATCSVTLPSVASARVAAQSGITTARVATQSGITTAKAAAPVSTAAAQSSASVFDNLGLLCSVASAHLKGDAEQGGDSDQLPQDILNSETQGKVSDTLSTAPNLASENSVHNAHTSPAQVVRQLGTQALQQQPGSDIALSSQNIASRLMGKNTTVAQHLKAAALHHKQIPVKKATAKPAVKVPQGPSAAVTPAGKTENPTAPPQPAGNEATQVQLTGTVAGSPNKKVQLRLAVPAGMTIQQALQSPALQQQLTSLQLTGLTVQKLLPDTAAPSNTQTTAPKASPAKTVPKPKPVSIAATRTVTKIVSSSAAPKAAVQMKTPQARTVMVPPASNMHPIGMAGRTDIMSPVNVLKASPAKASTPPAILSPRKSTPSSVSPSGVVLQPASTSSKLMLVNVNGQLMTTQGVPVTISQGMVQPLSQGVTTSTSQIRQQVVSVPHTSTGIISGQLSVPPGAGLQHTHPGGGVGVAKVVASSGMTLQAPGLVPVQAGVAPSTTQISLPQTDNTVTHQVAAGLQKQLHSQLPNPAGKVSQKVGHPIMLTPSQLMAQGGQIRLAAAPQSTGSVVQNQTAVVGSPGQGHMVTLAPQAQTGELKTRMVTSQVQTLAKPVATQIGQQMMLQGSSLQLPPGVTAVRMPDGRVVLQVPGGATSIPNGNSSQ